MSIAATSYRRILDPIFGQDVVNAWVCHFPDFDNASWFGCRVGDMPAHLAQQLPPGDNQFFCIGTIDPAADRRGVGNIIREYAVIADDVGTKIDPLKYDVLFALGFPRPNLRIETSPGNQTWLWCLDAPIERDDVESSRLLTLIRATMSERGLNDKGLIDNTRYIRLPGGKNTKPKYQQADGSYPDVRLVHADFSRRCSLDELGGGLLGPDWRTAQMPVAGEKMAQSQAGGGLVRTADLNSPDEWIVLMQEAGFPLRDAHGRPGVIESDCPFMDGHTQDGREDTGFAYLGGGLFHCTHSSCEHRDSKEFKDAIDAKYEEVTGNDAKSFRAGAAFETQGAKAGMTADDAKAEADTASLRATDIARNRRLTHEEALDDLCDRFVYYREAGAWFDTLERVPMKKDAFHTHPAVTPLLPAGPTGLKSATNELINRGTVRFIEGITIVPGSVDPLVEQVDDNGRLVLMGNKWRGSGYTPLAGTPTAWLECLEYVIPDKDYREYLLDWFAFNIQFPAKRSSHVPLIVGGQGVGKDLILEPFIQIIGLHNHRKVSMEDLASNFNDWMGCKFALLPELKLDEKGTLYNRIKGLTSTTASWAHINPKYGVPYSIKPVINFFASTNHMDSLSGIEHDDRRWAIYSTPAVRNTGAWYKRMDKELHSESEVRRVLWLLTNRDISNFDAVGPAPEFDDSKDLLKVESLSIGGRWVYDQLQPGGLFASRTVITTGEIVAAAQQTNVNQIKGTSQKMVGGALRVAGLNPIPNKQVSKPGKGTKRVRLWEGPLTADPVINAHIYNLNTKQLEDHYHNEVTASRMPLPF
ncbi:DUF5906 domain-containing protein [uncultured Cohaesibacter sp.]|uniref:DUF5906 domain-containing protein n=1 Tax=uncultured Cohaesibacter sp. TaxID=1002546 RepID=UPI0029C73C5D|nr:DUF5906 domain-containing protein [uncultured Cohaesibacter sp.]